MAHKRMTVEQLAQKAHLDTDEVLIALWDEGFDDILRPKDRVKDTNRARRALGLATRRELKSIAYWMSVLDMHESEFRCLLRKLAAPIGENAKKLPRKAISRLKSEARKCGIDPITGRISPPCAVCDRPQAASLEWRTIGHKRELRWLGEDEVLRIHEELVQDFLASSDPIEPAGVRQESLLASAVFRPQTALDGVMKYPTVEMSAAALMHSIIHDHPFHNGNKRTSLVSTLVFLDENGLFPEFDQDEAFKLVLDVAQHRISDPGRGYLSDRETLAIANWLCDHCRILEKGNRPMPFRKLRGILLEYGCELEVGGGSKVDITREVEEPSVLRKRKKRLHTQISYGGEGRDVGKGVVKKVREDLHLDDLHGLDAHAFYTKQPIEPTDFIVRYRKALRRLARF